MGFWGTNNFATYPYYSIFIVCWFAVNSESGKFSAMFKSRNAGGIRCPVRLQRTGGEAPAAGGTDPELSTAGTATAETPNGGPSWPSLFPLFVTQASGYRWKLSHEKGHGTSMEHHENNVKQCEAVKTLQNNKCLVCWSYVTKRFSNSGPWRLWRIFSKMRVSEIIS